MRSEIRFLASRISFLESLISNEMFLETDKNAIVAAIKEAELHTSGEIKVHIEEVCPESDPVERAKQVFVKLSLQNTALRNGVLFYIAFKDRKFAILGDSGIDKVVPLDFWKTTRDMLREYFSQGKMSEGLQAGIKEAGLQLKKFFPYEKGDINEISDDISIG